MNNETVLEIRDLTICYKQQKKNAVDKVLLSVGKGEVISIVGESGSGKSTLIRSILGLLPPDGDIVGGEIRYKDLHLEKMNGKLRRQVSGKEISMIFQDAGSYMDPIQKIGRQYDEFLRCHCRLSRKECRGLEIEMLQKVNLHDVDRILNSYPFELSGGMRQRVAIAMAMTLSPALLLADEPTSALDVTVQSHVVQQMVDLSEKEGTSIIIVTHNMGVASFMSDRIGVMKDGELLEFASREEVIGSPKEDYTKQLIEAIPELGDERFATKRSVDGDSKSE